MSEFKEAQRELTGLTARGEKRLLAWLAARMPPWVTPDRLTLLALLAYLGAGAAYALSRRSPAWLHAVNLCIAVNWFGDSLDGTLARFRNRLRPRYGFYVDHMADAFGTLFLLAGLGLSGYMSERVALGLLVVYLMLQIDTYLATYTLGTFRISHGPFGGTELRLLLVLGNLIALGHPRLALPWGDVRLYDLAGTAGIVGLTFALLVSSARNATTLFRMERLP